MPATDRLFFALRPDAAAVARLVDIAASLRRTHGVSGTAIEPGRLHVTLFHVGDFDGLPPTIVASARAAAEAVTDAAPFDVCFDRAMSFLGGPGRHPLVMRGGEALAPLMAFQRRLADTLAAHGLARSGRPYTPHVTLYYDPLALADEPVAPVSWPVTDFVLVDSHIGQHRHDVLARWPLGGVQA